MCVHNTHTNLLCKCVHNAHMNLLYKCAHNTHTDLLCKCVHNAHMKLLCTVCLYCDNAHTNLLCKCVCTVMMLTRIYCVSVSILDAQMNLGCKCVHNIPKYLLCTVCQSCLHEHMHVWHCMPIMFILMIIL